MYPRNRVILLIALGGIALAGCRSSVSTGGVLGGIEGTGSPQAGIEGTGVVSSVPEPTSLSSVYVNDVMFDASRSSILVDGLPAGVEALRPGMVVRIVGESMGDGSELRASRIEFDRILYGPVEPAGSQGDRFTLLGQAVRTDAGTVFEGISPRGTMTAPLCMVSGIPEPAGGWLATLVACRNDDQPGATEVEVEGLVSDLDLGAGYFQIGDLRVLFGEAALDLASGPLADGAWVEAVGRQGEAGVLSADRIRTKPFPETDRATAPEVQR